jgi:hypothetical protein
MSVFLKKPRNKKMNVINNSGNKENLSTSFLRKVVFRLLRGGKKKFGWP